jgi:hypothetical protein
LSAMGDSAGSIRLKEVTGALLSSIEAAQLH